MRHLFSLPLGSCAPPYAPSQKCSISAGALAAIAGGSALIGGIGNLISNANANKANREIAEATNAQNYKIWQEQLEAQKAFYNDQKFENRFLTDQAYQRELENREYNSPQAQKQRYLEAGINPYLASGSGSIGASSQMSVPSGNAPSGSVPSAPLMSSGAPYQAADFSGIGLSADRAMNYYLMAQKQQTDIAAVKQETDNKTAETIAKIRNLSKNDEYTAALTKKLGQDWQFNQDSYDERMRGIKLANDKILADQKYIEAQTEAQNFANSVAPELHKLHKDQLAAEINVAQAQAAEIYARKDLTEKEKDLVVHKISEQAIRNANLPKSLHNENAIQVATYNQIKKVGKKLDQETKNLEWEEKDLRKGYRNHFGNNRSLEDILEVAVKRNPVKGR